MELKKVLDEEGVSPNAYSLEGGYPFEQYTINENYGRWTVYYCERGIKRGERLFYSEDEACRYLLSTLLRDPTSRK